MPGGLLIDLRPFAGNWPLDVVTSTQQWGAGTLDDSQERPDDHAADTAIAAAVHAGWFVPEHTTTFRFAWYWDTLAELEAYIGDRWSTVMRLPPDTRRAVLRLLAAAGPGARLRFHRGMRFGRYRQADPP